MKTKPKKRKKPKTLVDRILWLVEARVVSTRESAESISNTMFDLEYWHAREQEAIVILNDIRRMLRKEGGK